LKCLQNVAALSGAALAAPAASHASTVTTVQVDQPASFIGTTDININGQPILSFSQGLGPGVPIGPKTASVVTDGSSQVVTDASDNILNLAPGSVVGPGSIFNPQNGDANLKQGNLSQTDPAFLGFSYQVGGQTDYGFVQLEVQSGPLFIDSYSYDSSGAPITVSSSTVPEPSTLALFAAGAVGVAALRRRRNKAAA
jgi:hypothetical protein